MRLPPGWCIEPSTRAFEPPKPLPPPPAVNRVPVEIWLYILSFIPDRCKHVYQRVNRLLHQIALDEIYRELCFVNPRVINVLRAKRKSYIRDRVRHIHIQPSFFPITRSYLSVFERRPTVGQLEIVGKSLAALTRVNQVTNTLHKYPHSSLASPFFQALWMNFGPILQTLSVHLTPENLELFLDPAVATELRCLTTLEVRFCDTRTSTSIEHNRDIIRSTLLPFTQVLCKYLTSLTICTSTKTYLGQFFNGVGYFPRSKRLKLCVFVQEDVLEEWDPPINFINRHAALIEDLTVTDALGLRAYRKWVHETLAYHHLLAVRKLSIDLYYNSAGNPHYPTDLKMLPSLDTLVLTGQVLQQSLIHETLPTNGRLIRRLNLIVDFISAKLVNTLAGAMPGLEELRLQYTQNPVENEASLPTLFSYN
ncbi:hypothetical protein H0H81_000113 [Sphagnurus paluster]|uniref:F-box domain-containing protein n=1 Tax=Sphagnurus paluster TaxID=117069 RepID=A0A9P7GP83_9AGAR|nr:hypothetical protein H0H81_000113 [Sphagnurus paluster]